MELHLLPLEYLAGGPRRDGERDARVYQLARYFAVRRVEQPYAYFNGVLVRVVPQLLYDVRYVLQRYVERLRVVELAYEAVRRYLVVLV